jgi:aminopeptidase N
LATTQFQSTSARYAFICYDEPEFKAKFNLKIVHDSSYSAISNTEGTETREGDITTTSFKTTPVMSAYLLAFIVSDFKYTTNENKIVAGETLHR